jgi:hypothetical protein
VNVSEYIEYLSLGGGPPSVALLVLAAWSEYTPRPDLIMFADTGNEGAETMRLLSNYESFAAEWGLDTVRVQAKEGPLEDYIREHSTPIPFHGLDGMSHRQCTSKWKIAPIEQELHRRYPNAPLSAHLGITLEESWKRMQHPKVKRNRNLFPLVEKRLRRADCVEIIKAAGLPVPPPSSCTFCPMHSPSRWQRLAQDSPTEFDEAAELDTFIRERSIKNGDTPIYLSDRLIPLEVLGIGWKAQQPLALGTEDLDDGCDSGYCAI